jgi:hypothetical protein
LSNGYARLELDYECIADELASFRDEAPDPKQLTSWFAEYEANHLIFVYKVNDQVWGQWDTKRSMLKEYKTTGDKDSPNPPEPEYQQWLKEKHGDSWKLYHWNKDVVEVNVGQSLAETLPNVYQTSAEFSPVDSEGCQQVPTSSDTSEKPPVVLGVGLEVEKEKAEEKGKSENQRARSASTSPFPFPGQFQPEPHLHRLKAIGFRRSGDFAVEHAYMSAIEWEFKHHNRPRESIADSILERCLIIYDLTERGRFAPRLYELLSGDPPVYRDPPELGERRRDNERDEKSKESLNGASVQAAIEARRQRIAGPYRQPDPGDRRNG